MKKVLSLILIFTLVFSTALVPSYASAEKNDDLTGHWSESTMRSWIEGKLITGYNDDTYHPDQSITRAEFCSLIDNVIGIPAVTGNVNFKDVSSEAWYASAVNRASSYGLVSGYGDGLFKPNLEITREEASVMVSKLLDENSLSTQLSLDFFQDANKISKWSFDALRRLITKGYISGYPDGTLGPDLKITRAEAVVMLSNVFGTIITSSGSYGKAGETYNNVTVTSSDVTLNDMTIEGDLYIAEAVDDGNVILNNVTINGDVIVKGGGENSIHFNNTNIFGTLMVKKADNKIRIVATGSTRVNVTYLESGGILVQDETAAEGFNQVVLSAEELEGLNVELVGDFKRVDVKSEGFKINLGEKSTIAKLNVEEKAKTFDIAGKGTVKEAEIYADKVKIDTKVTKLKIGDNANNVTTDGKAVKAGSTTNNATSSGGSTRSGGNGGSSNNDKALAVIDLSASSLQMTSGSSITVTAKVTYTTASMVTAQLIWIASDTKVAEVPRTGKFVSDNGGILTVENTVSSLATSPDLKISVYAVKNPKAADILSSDNVMASKSIDVVIYSKDTTFNVAFDVNSSDVTAVPSQKVTIDEKAIVPAKPTRTGYTFKGWYLEGTLYDFSNPVTKNITLTARWELSLDTNYVDERFDTGYPTVNITTGGYISVSFKLKESPTTPVTAYLIVDPYNADSIPDVTAVMHGHTGSGEHIVWAKYNTYSMLNDAQIVTVTSTAKVNDEKALVAIVLDDGTTRSSEPTIIEIEENTAGELDEINPRIEALYINNARTKLYAYSYDELDGSSTANVSDFSLTYEGNPVTITAVDVLEDAIKYYDAVELSVAGLSASSNPDKLELSYTGTSITDRAQVPNKLEPFTNASILDAHAEISDVYVASDSSYIGVEIKPGIETNYNDTENYTVNVYYASDFAAIGTPLEIKEADSAFNMDYINLAYEIVSPPAPVAGNTFYVTADIKTCTQDTSTVNSASITPIIVQPISIKNVRYEEGINRLEISYNGILNDSVYGCYYEFKITDSSGNTITSGTLSGNGYADPMKDMNARYTGESMVIFSNNFFYGSMPTEQSGEKMYIRYKPLHTQNYLKDTSGKEITEVSDWVEVWIMAH